MVRKMLKSNGKAKGKRHHVVNIPTSSLHPAAWRRGCDNTPLLLQGGRRIMKYVPPPGALNEGPRVGGGSVRNSCLASRWEVRFDPRCLLLAILEMLLLVDMSLLILLLLPLSLFVIVRASPDDVSGVSGHWDDRWRHRRR